MYQSIEVNAAPIRKTIDFLKAESTAFDMGTWWGDNPDDSPHVCDTVCCMGGAMAAANGMDPVKAETYQLADLMGIDARTACNLFNPNSKRGDRGVVVHWHMTRADAVDALNGLIDGSVGYNENTKCFGPVVQE